MSSRGGYGFLLGTLVIRFKGILLKGHSESGEELLLK